MAINQTPNAALRQPRGIVRVNGEIMAGWVDWEVDNNTFYHADNNTFYHADTFHVVFAIGGLPTGRDDIWFAAQSKLLIDIFGGFPADPNNPNTGELPQWITGYADEVEIDLVAREIHLHGRDLTAPLIDTQTNEKWRNQTSSDVAKTIAAKFGLTATYITPTTAKVGKYIETNTGQITSGQSYWHLLTMLANLENFVVYVNGQDLHFGLPPDINNEPYLFQWNTAPFTFNGSRLSVSHNMTLAQNAQVTVNSWHQRIGLVKAVYPATVPAGAKQYKKKFPNMLPDAAMAKAKALYKSIMQHEIKLTAELPADDLLTQTTIIKLIGTAYDQLFYPASIKRRMSVHDGYTMSVQAQNTSPQNAGQ
jgi:hypothetical protein